MRKKQKNLPPRIERFELKFTIPYEMVEPISEYAGIYCSLDKYSQEAESGFYRVNNLYMDSPNYLLLRMRLEGAERRFNMRVRAYGKENAQLPYFLEIKQKVGDIVKKYRAEVSDPLWHYRYQDCSYISAEEPDDVTNEKNKSLFERLVLSYNAAPKIQTQYLRKAFVSDVDEYARITFDTDLKFYPQEEYTFFDSALLIPCDTETVFDPGASVILELKCYAAYMPLWMLDMIKYFDLSRRSFSKYISGAIEFFESKKVNMGSRVAAFC